MKRAWQLARLNRKSFKQVPCVADWIAHAWKEARDGRTESWDFLSPEHKANSLRRQLKQAEMCNGSDRVYSDHNRPLIKQLRASLAELEAGRVHAQCAAESVVSTPDDDLTPKPVMEVPMPEPNITTPPFLRGVVEQRIEELIALLDFLDGDPDLEPSLGVPDNMFSAPPTRFNQEIAWSALGAGGCEDREEQCEDEGAEDRSWPNPMAENLVGVRS